MSDTRTIVVSIIGTGIAVITVVVGFIAIVAGGINSRIGDLNATVNSRIDDVSTTFNARIDDVNSTVNARFDDVGARIDDVQTDLRELRALVIEALKVYEAAKD